MTTFTVIFVKKFQKNSSTYQQAASSEIPFYYTLSWNSPRIKWAICVIFAEDACWIVAGGVFDMNW